MLTLVSLCTSGTRTNLKVHGETPASKMTCIVSCGALNSTHSRGDTSGAKRRKKLFLAPNIQLVVLMSAFVIGSTVLSVSCLLFFYVRFPRAQPFVKVGGTCPPPLCQSALLLCTCLSVCYSFYTVLREVKYCVTCNYRLCSDVRV